MSGRAPALRGGGAARLYPASDDAVTRHMVWTRRALVLSRALCGCARAHDVDAENGVGGGAAGAPPSSPVELDAECVADIERSLDGLPEDFVCAGLYSDIASKEV